MARNSAQDRITPRLLSKKDAAAYLGYKTTTILDKINIKPIPIATIGGRNRELYDRAALDHYLDCLSGIQNIGESAKAKEDDPDEAFRRWDQGRKAYAA